MDLLPAETSSFPSPIPTQFVPATSSLPAPQTDEQQQVEARIKELGDAAREAPGHEPPRASSRPRPAWRRRSSR